MQSLQEIHHERGRSFAELYSVVTYNIEHYQCVGDTKYLIDQFEIIGYWVDGFSDKYNNWIPVEQAYLQELYGYNGQHKPDKFEPLFTLCALAFLHIVNDLPITISESLKEGRFSHYTTTVCNLNNLKKIFNELENPLREAIRGNWKKPWFAKLMLIWKDAELELIFMLWIVALRNKAWDDGVSLYCLSSNKTSSGNPPDDKSRHSILVLNAMKNAKSKSKLLFHKRILALQRYSIAGIASTVVLYFLSNNGIAAILYFIVVGIYGIYFYNKSMKEVFKKILMLLYEVPEKLDNNRQNEVLA